MELTFQTVLMTKKRNRNKSNVFPVYGRFLSLCQVFIQNENTSLSFLYKEACLLLTQCKYLNHLVLITNASCLKVFSQLHNIQVSFLLPRKHCDLQVHVFSGRWMNVPRCHLLDVSTGGPWAVRVPCVGQGGQGVLYRTNGHIIDTPGRGCSLPKLHLSQCNVL